jgi:hypothetical protein
MIENRKINDQWNVVMIVMLIATLVLAILSRVISDKETADVLKWISIGLMAGIFITRLLKGRFGTKPSREELEEKVFGNKNKSAAAD